MHSRRVCKNDFLRFFEHLSEIIINSSSINTKFLPDSNYNLARNSVNHPIGVLYKLLL